MDNWIAISMVVIVAVILIGNLSTFEKNAKQPLRRKGLNDMKETLPRSNKHKHKLATVKTKNSG